MAIKKFSCPPQASAQGSFSDNLVGFQLTSGGGLTQGNFEFTTGVSEKVNRRSEEPRLNSSHEWISRMPSSA